MSESSEPIVAEPWPVWWACRTSKTTEPGGFSLTPARFLKLPLMLALASLFIGLLALVSGHLVVPLLLVLVHVPSVLRLYFHVSRDLKESLRIANDDPQAALYRAQREAEEFETQSKLQVEVMRNSPTLPDDYLPMFPLLLNDTELASFHRHPQMAWSRYAHFEVVERSGTALIVRLAETPETSHAYWNDTLSFVSGGWWESAGQSFLKRLEASAPMIGALWIFLVGLIGHGWRIDTVTAFCVWQAHLLFYSGLSRLWRQVQAHDFARHPNYTYLAFDLRAVSEDDALTRLTRHLAVRTDI